jgi:hypothetical protein
VIEASRGTRQADSDTPSGVLVITRGEREETLVRARLDGTEIEAWAISVRWLHGDREDAALDAATAIGDIEPALVLFVGAGVATTSAPPGGVVIADRVTALERGAGPRIKPRRRTRRADPDLLRHARRVCNADRTGTVSLGLVAMGSQGLAIWEEHGREAHARMFTGAVGLDPSGWDFLFAYYDDEELPALAVLGIVGDAADEADTATACQRAADVTLALLAAVTPARLHEDPAERAAEEGETQHLRGDAESLAHESTQGIVQHPFLDSARVEHARATTTPRATAKGHVGPLRLHALFDPRLAPPMDLWLRIFLRDNRRLEFELISHHPELPYSTGKLVGELELRGDFGSTPMEYRASLKDQIRKIAARPEKSDIEALENIGNRLYNDLFPPELKQAYAEFRTSSAETLLITSEEPWIPWELVRPHDPAFPDDDFLCMRFAMTRWLGGLAEPFKHGFTIRSFASLEAGSVKGEEHLASAKEECDYIAELAARCHVENLSPSHARYEHVKTLLRDLERPVSLWHVAAHGRLGDSDPDESIVVFEDDNWRAGDLAGRYGHGIQAARPLVFFNACLVGQQDFSVSQLAGWPNAWVVQNHCGGFLAPQWSVNSALATVFSKAFYTAVVGDGEAGVAGQTLGEAARTARRTVREANPVDPTWLSYAVYGHPNARVRFGEEAHAVA